MARSHARLLLLCLAFAACGTTDDNRPLDAQYVTESILQPTCGGAICHSTWKQSRGDVFDTLEGMRASIVHNGLVSLDSLQFDPSDPASAALIVWVTKTDPFGLGIGRMPYDGPMPNQDVHFLENWIVGPTKIRDDKTPCSPTLACTQPDDTCSFAHPGDAVGNCVNITYTAPAKGAQCDPAQFHGQACFNRTLVNCNSDWNFGSVVMACPSDCSQGACL